MTDGINRRGFIKAGAAVVGATKAMGMGAAAAQAAGPDLIFLGGPIVTMVDAAPSAEAIAVTAGRISAVGTVAEITALASETTQVIDLQGRTLLPAFIDAHGHFMNSLQVVAWANVSPVPVGPVTAIPDIIAALKAHVEKRGHQARRMDPGLWLRRVGAGRRARAVARRP